MIRVPGEALPQVPDLAVSARLFLDYGTFVWMELSEEDFLRLQSSGVAYEERAEPYALRLGGEHFDPVKTVPALPTGWDRVRTDVPDLHLVQLVGPTRAEWLTDLKARGLLGPKYG